MRGEEFGTDCNETERPIPPLGDPQRGIRIRLVQDGRGYWTTTVDADPEYQFAVPITIPRALHPGVASVEVNGSASRGTTTAITITGAAPSSTTPRAATEARDNNRSWMVWVVGLGLSLAITAALAARASRRRSHSG